MQSMHEKQLKFAKTQKNETLSQLHKEMARKEAHLQKLQDRKQMSRTFQSAKSKIRSKTNE